MAYGYCPICGAKGRTRERRPNGNDKCENGHTYPSRGALRRQPDKYEVKLRERDRTIAKLTESLKEAKTAIENLSTSLRVLHKELHGYKNRND